MAPRYWFFLFLASMTLGFTLDRVQHPASDSLVRFAVESKSLDPNVMREMVGRLKQQGLDVAGVNRNDGTIEVITTTGGIQALKTQGINGSLRESHSASFLRLDSRYLNSQKVEDELKSLQQRFPDLTRLEKIGTSLEGRAIWALLLSTTPHANDKNALSKPAIIFDGMHHAREIMTPEVVLDVAQTILPEARSKNSPLANILSRWNIWIVPMLNVDGNNVVWTKNSYWRKNAHADENSKVFGVDLNRNYPFMWSGCNGSSGSKNSDTYRGDQAASEPESTALIGLARRVLPTASLSYHSFSEFVLYPFGCGELRSSENLLHATLGKEMADMLPSDSNDGSTYVAETPWKLLYSADGESMSFMHSEFGATAFTFEINQEFQPDYGMREQTLVKHRKAWQHFLSRIDRNLLSIRVTQTQNENFLESATIEFDTIQHQHGEKPFRTNSAGQFFKVLDPGKYLVRARLPDGRFAEATVEMNGEPKYIELNL